jgi:rhodanese-related sulfurtransferase
MKAIAPGQLPQLLRAQPNLQLLVVRTSGEYFEMDALPARNVPLDIPVPKELFDSCDLSEDRAVYLLCRTGERAKKAGVKFEKEGFSPAVVVGGTPAWSEAGLPIERDAIDVISLDRQVRIAASSLVLICILLGSSVRRAFFGLSAFVGTGLVFARITDFCGRGLLLSRLPWSARKPA